jgi:hypothetical protein
VTDIGREARLRCGHCRDVIGVYEPLVVLAGGGDARSTSVAAEPWLVHSDPDCYHQTCYEQARGESS